MVLLAIAACADSNEADAPEVDGGISLPWSDAGDEARPEAESDAGPAVMPCAPGELCPVSPSLTPGAIAAIKGRSKDDVWASGTGGLVAHWDGKRWTPLESHVNETLSSIFLTADEMWAASGTLILRRGLDPASARTARLPLHLRFVAGVAVLSNEEAYVGIGPSQLYFGKVSFDAANIAFLPDAIHPITKEAQPYLGARALFLDPNKAIWLVGEHAAVVRYPITFAADAGAPIVGNGVVVPLASQTNLLAAWAHDEHLWVTGGRGTILHFDGAEWHDEKTSTTVTLNAIFGLAPDDIWAAGEHGTVLHFDGAKWSPVGVGGFTGSLRAIWGSAPDDVWIGGESGMFHWGAVR